MLTWCVARWVMVPPMRHFGALILDKEQRWYVVYHAHTQGELKYRKLKKAQGLCSFVRGYGWAFKLGGVWTPLKQLK